MNSATFNFTGSQVLVTGGSNGIGFAIASAFADAGAVVTITGTRLAVSDYENDLSRFTYRQCNMSDRQQIADLALDDEALAKAHAEIEASASVLGDFSEKTQIYSYHIDAGVVTPNEVRQKIGLDEIQGGDSLIEPKEITAPSDTGNF